MKRKIINNITRIIIILSMVILIAGIYYKQNYSQQTFDSILYYLENGFEKSNNDVLIDGIVICIIPLVVMAFIVYLPITEYGKKIIYIDIKRRKGITSLQIYPNKFCIKFKFLYVLVILIISICITAIQIGAIDFLKNQAEVSMLFEEYYIPSQDVKISFPEQKRNLIYVFLESMESTLISSEEGGGWQYTIIPELKDIADTNISFSNTNKVGGAIQVYGTTWTSSGMVAETSGIPLKLGNIEGFDVNEYKGYSSFLPGAYTLGDILKEQGYNLEVMFGSDSNFGGRKDYFTVHGNYKIFDVNTAIEQGKMEEKDKVWWGFDDDDLFEWSKEEILNLASKDQPFNFIMLTADTHFTDGYLSENVKNTYDTQYENVFAYSSKSVSQFVEWIQKQDFYENTTIVLVGDHIGMQTQFYEEHLPEQGFERTIYNAIINSSIKTDNNKNRMFSSLDIFPTVLASMGVKIEGDRLGLGTNLFSERKTLIEELGFDTLNTEIMKKSNYYNNNLLGDNYIEILRGKKNEE